MKAPAGTAGYGSRATELAAQYESITFEAVHRDVIHLFPQHDADVLDIGAGSGRDAAALAARGHRVVAVEPTLELRQEGKRLHPLPNLEWVDDHLPLLHVMSSSTRRFDLILLTAVWMHLDEAERKAAMSAVAELVRANNLSATMEQIKAHVDDLAASYEKPEEVVRWYFGDNRRLSEVEAVVIENNVTDHILGKAKVSEKALAFDELMGQ